MIDSRDDTEPTCHLPIIESIFLWNLKMDPVGPMVIGCSKKGERDLRRRRIDLESPGVA